MAFWKPWAKLRGKTNINLFKMIYMNHFAQNKYFPKLLHIYWGKNSRELEMKCESEEIHRINKFLVREMGGGVIDKAWSNKNLLKKLFLKVVQNILTQKLLVNFTITNKQVNNKQVTKEACFHFWIKKGNWWFLSRNSYFFSEPCDIKSHLQVIKSEMKETCNCKKKEARIVSKKSFSVFAVYIWQFWLYFSQLRVYPPQFWLNSQMRVLRNCRNSKNSIFFFTSIPIILLTT